MTTIPNCFVLPADQMGIFKDFCKYASRDLELRFGVRLRGQKLLNLFARHMNHHDYNALLFATRGQKSNVENVSKLTQLIYKGVAAELQVPPTKVKKILSDASYSVDREGSLQDKAMLLVARQALSKPPKSMNHHRKLMILGVNELLEQELITLNWDGQMESGGFNHHHCIIAGEKSVVLWRDIGFGEYNISVWWNYNHAAHPQADLNGNYKESFTCSSPLAKRSKYKDFVGAVCSGWLERNEGRHIQGYGSNHLIETYTRKADLQTLKDLPIPTSKGFKPEGKFYS